MTKIAADGVTPLRTFIIIAEVARPALHYAIDVAEQLVSHGYVDYARVAHDGNPVDPQEPITVDIHGCARCHGDGHPGLEFKPLTHPVPSDLGALTHWASCPTNGEPIFLGAELVGLP
jgi:hypothetical protein